MSVMAETDVQKVNMCKESAKTMRNGPFIL